MFNKTQILQKIKKILTNRVSSKSHFHNDSLNPYLIRHVIKYGAKTKAKAPPNISPILLLFCLNISIIVDAIIEIKKTDKIYFLFLILQLHKLKIFLFLSSSVVL
jgi:hypothetical protein